MGTDIICSVCKIKKGEYFKTIRGDWLNIEITYLFPDEKPEIPMDYICHPCFANEIKINLAKLYGVKSDNKDKKIPRIFLPPPNI